MKIPEVYLIDVDHRPGCLARVLTVVGDAGLTIHGLESVRRSERSTTWELTVELEEQESDPLFRKIDGLEIARVIGRSDRVFTRHIGGKIESVSRVHLSNLQVLRDVYTPGVARVCLAIHADPEKAWDYTGIPRTVAIVTDGTAILGLGDIGPVAGMPVMEGKAALFHALAGLSGVPILLQERDPDKIVEAVLAIAPSFGAIQLEDIAAPACFRIEEELIERAGRPVLHDDQHATAVVVLAALLTAARQAGRELGECVVGQVGLGAAGIGIGRLIHEYGVRELIGADRSEEALERFEAGGGKRATLDEMLSKSDVVIATTGAKGLIRPEQVREGQVILALSNPEPEIEPDVALEAGAAFAADGKSVNNVLVFPGLFRGALEARARRFTPAMLIAAAETLADLTPDGDLVPDALDRAVHQAVSSAVKRAAMG